MVDEHEDKYESHEEGEYHFTDENMDYEESTPEAPKSAAPEQVDAKQNVKDFLSKYRRMIIGVVVFFGLIFIIYKLLSPGAQAPATEFASANKPLANAPVPKTPKPLVPPISQEVSQQTAAQAVPAQPSLPSVEVTVPQPAQMTVQTQPPSQQVAQQPMQQSMQQSMQTGTTTQARAPASQQPMSPAQILMPQATMASSINQPPPAPESETQNKMIMERLSNLENQNEKFMNSLQTQFAQKMTDYENQNNVMQEKVHILNKRISNMEASLNKMAQLLEEQGAVAKMPVAVGVAGLPPSRAIEPRLAYTVQAIIPGRAWLKSDAGDTVTVAEGDILKDYGRIIKIDPYDGIVQIDTGTKRVSLSYGTNSD